MAPFGRSGAAPSLRRAPPHPLLFGLVWVDVFGLIVRVDVYAPGSCHDRRLFTQTSPQLSPATYFDGEQHAIGDTGFIGSSRVLVFPFRRNTDETGVDRDAWNTDIRRSRIRNEWGIGDVKNRFRLFLGRWSYEPELFAPTFELCCMLCNWRWKQSGDRIVPLHRQLANLDDYNTARLLFS